MISGAFVRFIKKVVDGFSAVCAFLLIKLKLWISVIFALLYIMVCAVSGVELKGAVVNYFIGGIVACFALAIVLSVLAYYKKNAPKKEAYSNVPRVKMYGGGESNEYGGYNYSLSGNKPETGAENNYITEEKRYNYSAYTENAAAVKQPSLRSGISDPPKYDDFADLKKKYFERGVINGGAETKPARAPENISDTPALESVQEKAAPVHLRKETDTPMIFAMRKNPDILIYEFSDRLEFYRKTKSGLEPEKVEYKS